MRIFCDAETKHGNFFRSRLEDWSGNKQSEKYVCSSIVNRMESKITALSRAVGKGACFVITSKYSWTSDGSESLADCFQLNKECAFVILV
jgi:hypothetical protein